jgi:hypothetical protein
MCRVLIVAAALLLAVADAQEFYVSPAGADAANGTSPATAWLTLGAAAARVRAVHGSWTLLLERGGVWLDDPLVVRVNAVANVPRDVAVAAYGDAARPLPLVMLSRAMSTTGPCVALLDVGSGSSTVWSIHVSGGSTGVSIEAQHRITATNVVVAGCVFLDVRAPFLQYTPANPAWAAAVTLGPSFRPARFANVTVQRNVAARVDAFFRSRAYTDGMLLDRNTVQQCAGNCYTLGGGRGITLSNSVMLRDVAERLFLYGTTDVIVGGLDGDNALVDNDFNHRGEYEGGPDGCAFDFETAASGFLVRGNTFYKSWGSGIMIFGHSSTSHNVTIAGNVFNQAGCTQSAHDRGGIAVMCPHGHIPTAAVTGNSFYTCPNTSVPAIFVNPNVEGCGSGLVLSGNAIDGAVGVVEMPQLRYEPPSPSSTAQSGSLKAVGVTRTVGAIIRYTLDGSRPTEASAVLPPVVGIELPWPGPIVAVNLRAFKPGMHASVTNGAVVELNYGFGREAVNASKAGPSGMALGCLEGTLDGVDFGDDGSVSVRGWAVDPLLPRGGWGPATVVVSVDFAAAAAAVALLPRPDLVKAGVAPNPDHGFELVLPAAVAKVLTGPGRHVVGVKAVGSPSALMPRPLPMVSEIFICDGKVCKI